MASTMKATVQFSIRGVEVVSDGPLKGVNQRELTLFLDMANGTTDGKCDLVYSDQQTGIGASVTTVYDLDTSLADLSGGALDFAEVVLIAIRNRSATAANYLLIGPDATAGFGVVASNKGFWADASDRNVVPADFNTQDGDGSWVILYSRGGVPVAAASTDELAIITQGGTSANAWDLLIIGRSA